MHLFEYWTWSRPNHNDDAFIIYYVLSYSIFLVVVFDHVLKTATKHYKISFVLKSKDANRSIKEYTLQNLLLSYQIKWYSLRSLSWKTTEIQLPYQNVSCIILKCNTWLNATNYTRTLMVLLADKWNIFVIYDSLVKRQLYMLTKIWFYDVLFPSSIACRIEMPRISCM